MYFGDRADGTAGKEKAASLAAEILKEPSGYAKEVVNFARSLQPPQGGKDVRSQAKAGARRLLRALQLDDWVRYHILKRGTIEARIAASLNWWQGGRR
jgi:hypothetical protein